MSVRRRCRGVPIEDAVTVRRAVRGGVEQVRAHELLGVRDRVRPRPGLTVGGLLGREGARGYRPVTRRGGIGVAPPRLGETTRVIRGGRTPVRGASKVRFLNRWGRDLFVCANTDIARAICSASYIILQLRLLPDERCDVTRPLVHHREDALRGSLTLGVGLCLDSIHVGGTGREALAQHRNAASGRGPRNHDDGVVAHGLGSGVQKGRRDHLRFLQSCCHRGAASLIT